MPVLLLLLASSPPQGLLDAARTVDTSEEARAVGVAEPVVVESGRGGGGGSRSVSRLRFRVELPVVERWLLLVRDLGKRCEVRGVTMGVSKLGPSWPWRRSS